MAEINPTAINPFNRNALASPATTEPASNIASNSVPNFWGEDGFTFGDILDLLNPLQHIPIIGTIYRAVTGDEISTGSRIVGAGLFGGVIGAGVAVVSAIIEDISGDNLDERILAMFDGEETPAPDGAPAPAVLASAETSYGFDRRDQEAAVSDWTSRAPAAAATTVAALASAERDDAFNPAFGRGAQEATMTSPAFLIETPAAPAPDTRAPDTEAPVLAALPIERPVERPVERPAVQTLAAVESPLPLIPRDAAWLAALPRAGSAFSATAIRYMTPETGLQIVRAMAGNGALKPTGERNAFTRFAIDLYSQQALAAKASRIEPSYVDILY